MQNLMSQDLQDKIGISCFMHEIDDDEEQYGNDVLTEIVVDKDGYTTCVYVFGEANDVDTLRFDYEDEYVMSEWEQWQFELWVERNIAELIYNWQNNNSPAMFYTELI